MASFLLVAVLVQGQIGVPPTRIVSLSGEWRFQAGDSAVYAEPGFDDSAWPAVHVPGSWTRYGYPGYRGFAWYRSFIAFGSLPTVPIGIQLRSVASAYELYVDGVRLGGVGGFPPEYRARSGVALTVALPVRSLGPGAHLLAVRVYSEASRGGLVGEISLGPLQGLTRRDSRRDLGLLATALLLFGIGLYQVFFWFRRAEGREHLYLFLYNVGIGLFFLTLTNPVQLAMSPWVHWFRLYVALAAASVAAFCFAFRGVFDVSEDRVIRWFGVYFLVLAPIGLVLPSWEHLRFASSYLLNPAVLACGGIILFSAIVQVRRGVEHARTLLWGTAVLVAALCHDIAIDWGLVPHRTNFPLLIPVGTLAFAASAAATTARRVVETETIALYDRLTGLYRREVVMDALTREIRRAARVKQPLAVIMMDLDRFKAVNDSLGHEAGDRVLAEVGRRLAEAGRAVDWLGRYGGEEFLAVLAASDQVGAVLAAERFRQAVGALPIDVGRASRAVTLSAGVATYDGGEEWPTAEQLVGTADAALYRAKETGRNKVMTS